MRKLSEAIDEQKVIKSIMIAGALMIVFLALILALWAGLFNTYLNPIQSSLYIIRDVLAIIMLTLYFIFLFITVALIKEYTTKVRSGWTEVIITLIIVGALGLLFNIGDSIASVLLSILFIIYLHMSQE